ncbi:MAG TPA: magnesium chelatase subunit D family protein [Candidatus Nitrosotalea sp.]|nr:magnesium chelatase subunit D family protein [Candidatus Nitrosotalea sp.]
MIEVRHTYPFSAIVGQERMKLALILNAVHSGIGGVLIRGERGTGKSTAVRALARLLPEQVVVQGCAFGDDPQLQEHLCIDCRRRLEAGENPLPTTTRRMRVVDLPINASEDRVVGSIDLEAALRSGHRRFDPGVLAEANRNILYVDEVNLLDDHIVDVLLDAAAMGVNVVEREGISVIHPSRFILVGTMNPEEGELRPQLLDRFGLCVDVEGIRDADLRVEIAEREALFRSGDTGFVEHWQAQDQLIAGMIQEAIDSWPQVQLDAARNRLVSQICVQAGVQGHRGDVVTARTAQTLAAWRGHPAPSRDDVYDAAELALAHRSRANIEREREDAPPSQAPGEGEESEGTRESTEPGEADNSESAQASGDGAQEQGEQDGGQQATGSSETQASEGSAGVQGDPQTDETFQLKKIELPKKRAPRKQTGKRATSKSNDRRGRYVRAENQERVTDLAVDATVRAAAPHQVRRGRQLGENIRLMRHDLQQKVRERKVGNLIVFVVDASASMDAEQRMAATKGAILSLLQDAYVRRDRVAVVVFKNRSSEVVLRPTSSIALAQRRLERLSVGGTTPLTHGLMSGYKVIKSALARDPSIRPLLVLISDGRGNISMFKEEPLIEAQKMAALIQSEKIDCLVIDSARDFSYLPSVQHLARVAPMYQSYAMNACADLAERMGARYYGLYDLSREEIASAVAKSLGQR